MSSVKVLVMGDIIGLTKGPNKMAAYKVSRVATEISLKGAQGNYMS